MKNITYLIISLFIMYYYNDIQSRIQLQIQSQCQLQSQSLFLTNEKTIRIVPGLNEALNGKNTCYIFGTKDSDMYLGLKALPRHLIDEVREDHKKKQKTYQEIAISKKATESLLKKLRIGKHFIETHFSGKLGDEIKNVVLDIEEIINKENLIEQCKSNFNELNKNMFNVKLYDEWIEKLEKKERDGRYNPYPEITNVVNIDVFTKSTSIPYLVAVPALISGKAMNIAINGSVEHNVSDVETRLCLPIYRDFLEVYPIMCYRDEKNNYYDINCFFPLSYDPSIDDITQCLGNIYYGHHKKILQTCDFDKGCEILLRISSAFTRVLLSKFNEENLELFQRIYICVNSALSKLDEQHLVKNEWHRQVLTMVTQNTTTHMDNIALDDILFKIAISEVPWSHCVQSFMRIAMKRFVGRYKMRDTALPIDYFGHLQTQTINIFRRYLFILALGNKQFNIKNTYQSIQNVKTLVDVFLLLGYCDMKKSDKDVGREILKLIHYALSNNEIKQKETALTDYTNAKLEDLRNVKQLSINIVDIENFWQIRKRSLSNDMEELVKLHSQKVIIPQTFDNNVCFWCKKVYPNKDKLLREHVEPILSARYRRPVNLKNYGDPFYSYTVHHRNITRETSTIVEDGKFICSAVNCQKKFDTENNLFVHQMYAGVIGDWTDIVKHTETKKEIKMDNVDHLECGICMDSRVNCMSIPCGHQNFCKPCLKTQDKCPMCRSDIKLIIDIAI